MSFDVNKEAKRLRFHVMDSDGPFEQALQEAYEAGLEENRAKIKRYEEALKKIAKNCPDTDMTQERLYVLLGESWTIADKELRHRVEEPKP